jgi:hypothetical protein
MKNAALFQNKEDLFNAMQNAFESSDVVDFSGCCTLAADPLADDKEQVRMMIHEIWKVTSYRFT